MDDFQINMPDEYLEDADQLKQQRLAEQARLDEVQSQQAEPVEQAQPEQPEQPQQEEKGFFDASPQYEYLEGIPDNPVFAPMGMGMRVAGNIATGTVDQVMDTASFLVPWLKPADEWWEEVSYRKETTGFDKAVRDIGGFLVPFLGLKNLAIKGATMGATRLGMTGLNKGLPHILKTIGADVAVGMGLTATSDNTSEAGNLGSLVEMLSYEAGMGVQVPWASRESDNPDVIYQKNMFEEAALSGVTAVVDLAFSKYGLGRAGAMISTQVKGKTEAAQAIVDSSTVGKTAHLIDPVEKARIRENAISNSQTNIAVERFNKGRVDFEVSGQEPQYDPFVNEPHLEVDRAVQDPVADPIAFKVDNAMIQNNVGTVNGRARPGITDHYKNKFLNAADNTERGEMLEELGSVLDTPVTVTHGDKTLTAKQVDDAAERLVSTAFNEPENFVEEFNKLQRDSITLYDKEIKAISEPAFATASKAFKRLFETLSPTKQKASAAIVTQSAGNVSDAARASELISGKFRTTRQQELVFDALKVMLPEIRVNQAISGEKLRLKNLVKQGKVLNAEELAEASSKFDETMTRARKETLEFVETAMDITRQRPAYFAPLMREFIKSNGDVNSIDKLSRLMVDKISFWKKAFYNGEPEIPSLLVQQLQSARYNHILTGLAPVRAATGAAVGLIGKPVTTFVGAAARADLDDFSRATFVFGGVMDNLKRGFNAMSTEWKYALEAPEEAMARSRKDYANDALKDMESLEDMKEIWRSEGQNGRVAVANMISLLGNYNGNPIVRFGMNAMTAIDGFTKSMSASMAANAKAYDQLYSKTKGKINVDDFKKLSTDLYNQSFDSQGVLKEGPASYAAGEMNLNLDSNLVSALDSIMARLPVAKSIFMFPRTGINAINLMATFSPTGIFGQSLGRARSVLNATTQFDIDRALVAHGYKAGDMAAFDALKSEYTGRQIMGSAVTMGAAVWALQGNLTGSGPADEAQKRAMQRMGWEPFSIRDPITGEWRSYQGLEPFDTFLGLVADVVYEGQRADQAITEDMFRTIASSISLNITQKTFLSGFEPLAKLLSNDPSGFSRFFAMNIDAAMPGTGIRSILNRAIAPQLKDVENNVGAWLANRNKFLPPVNAHLMDEIDIFTGEPINAWDPLTAAINSVLPVFKTNGKVEEWRQILIDSGWSGLQDVRRNPISGEPLTPEERKSINTWIGQNYNLGAFAEKFVMQKEDYWKKEIAKYKKERGLQTQEDYPIKATLLHKGMDELVNDAYKAATRALAQQDSALVEKGQLRDAVKSAMTQGQYGEAKNYADQIRQLNSTNTQQ